MFLREVDDALRQDQVANVFKRYGIPIAAAIIVGLLVVIGLFVRPAALLGSGTMAYAYFTAHQPKALWPIDNGGEPAILYCFAFLLIAFTGAGAFAVQRGHRG